MRCFLYVSLVLLLLLTLSFPARADRIDDYIKVQMQRHHIPGLSLTILKDGKVVKTKGYGLANLETGTPATPETVYKIASISKQFLATGILMLVQEGKLRLDDTIVPYLDDVPDTWKGITIRHLLTHTSGMVEDPPGFQPFKQLPDAEVIKAAYMTPLLFAPGERWSYSNLAYFVLGEIIRKVSGKPWSAFLHERLFIPLGMTATRTTTTTDLVPHRAAGYTDYNWTRGTRGKAEDWVAVRPSGAFLTTVQDMAKWDAALGTQRILPATLWEEMWTPVRRNGGMTSPYGLGWFLDPWQGHKRIHHNGGLPGFVSDYERFVDDKLTVILMVNADGVDCERMAMHIAGFYVPTLAPPVDKPIPDTEPEITTRVRAMITGYINDNLDITLFTSKFLEVAQKVRLGDTLRGPGALQSITLVERREQGLSRIYRYRLVYKNYSLHLICGFNRENQINGFGIQPDVG